MKRINIEADEYYRPWYQPDLMGAPENTMNISDELFERLEAARKVYFAILAEIDELLPPQAPEKSYRVENELWLKNNKQLY